MSDYRNRDDRTVHASNPDEELVRYDRAGKWYVEPVDGSRRRHVGINEAVRIAVGWSRSGNGVIFTGLHGGSMFEAKVLSEAGR